MEIMSEERADYIAETLKDEEVDESPIVEFRDPVKELGFAKIDHIITLDVKLSDGAYRTYALLYYYWQRKHVAWAGTDTLAIVRGIKESTVRKHLKELQDAGLITRQRRMGKTSMTYLEDLPERYAAAAAAILTKRQKNRAKSAIKVAVSPLPECPREGEPLEGEPLKERGAKTAPTPIEKEPMADAVRQPCSHPITAIRSSDEGTQYCQECADVAALDEIPGASSAPVQPNPQQAMISALATVCGIDLSLCNGKYAKAAQRLVKAGYAASQITELYGEGGEWYQYDWRGRDKHDPPNIGSINETIQRAVSGAWKQSGNGNNGKIGASWIDDLKKGFAIFDEATNGGN